MSARLEFGPAYQGHPKDTRLVLLTPEERKERHLNMVKARYNASKRSGKYQQNRQRMVEYSRRYYEENKKQMTLKRLIIYHRKAFEENGRPKNRMKMEEYEQELKELEKDSAGRLKGQGDPPNGTEIGREAPGADQCRPSPM